MSLLPAPVEQLIAWGQYMHWAHIQFGNFRSFDPAGEQASRIGIVAHWLAAEHVVLEGWTDLKISDQRVTRLLSVYPEHANLLRRCRNAVYHFQKSPLDDRLTRMLLGEDEEITWSVALHFEFQGVLLQLADQLRSAGAHGRQVVVSLAGAIGWFPRHPYADEVEPLLASCREYEEVVGSSNSPEADNARVHIAQIRAELAALDMYPLTSSLKRMAP